MKYVDYIGAFDDVFLGALSSKFNKLNKRCYMKQIMRNIF